MDIEAWAVGFVSCRIINFRMRVFRQTALNSCFWGWRETANGFVHINVHIRLINDFSVPMC